MAKVTIYVEDCRDKVSPNCTKTFERVAKRGRPQLSCNPCREFTKTSAVSRKSVAQVASHTCNADGWDCMVNNGVQEHHQVSVTMQCPCGNSFVVATGGRGRKATKCEACREAGTVYRTNDDGMIEAIRAETLAEEQREKAEQAGRERADRLFQMMRPLIERDNKRRKVAA